MGVLMLVNFCNCSCSKAVGLIHVTLYQPFYYLPRTDGYAKRTILLCLGGCDPGVDITDVYCVGLSSVLKFSLPVWGEDGPVVQVEMVCCIRRVTQ